MNRKRILAAILAVAMALTLLGCGKVAEKKKETKAGEETPSDTAKVWLLHLKTVGEETTTYEYNEAGIAIRAANTAGEIRYTYDAAGRLTLTEKFQGSQRVWQQAKTYDAKGNLTALVESQKDTEVYREAYTYDENGRAIEKVVTENGESYRLWYRYDENGRLQSAYEAQNGDRLRATYTYDGNGRLIEESWFSDTEHTMRILRTYYADGTLCKEEYRSPIRNAWTWEEYLYNQKGQLVMHLVYARAAEHERQEYVFDENGNLKEEISYKNGSEIYRAKYTYAEVELPNAVADNAAAQNGHLWMGGATEPALTVFKFDFQVKK